MLKQHGIYIYLYVSYNYLDSKVHGSIMGPIWGRQEPGGPHVGPMNFAIWVMPYFNSIYMITTKDTANTMPTHKILGIHYHFKNVLVDSCRYVATITVT